MFWVFVLAIGIAITFSTIGAYTVWFKLFAVGFKVVLFVVGIFTLGFIWKRLLKRPTDVER